jgi:IPT/TIG domain
VKGGIDILDAHSGMLRLRTFLPQQLMTDTDGLRDGFLATDENGQRLFALTSSDGTPQNASLTIVQLAKVPLGIGTVSPASVSAASGTTLSIRGSGFQNGITATIKGKTASVSFTDSNTLSIVVPAVSSGAQQLTLTNPDGETVPSMPPLRRTDQTSLASLHIDFSNHFPWLSSKKKVKQNTRARQKVRRQRRLRRA